MGAVMTVLPVHTGPSFTVHLHPHGAAWRVYIQRHWPQGVDFAQHMAETFEDQGRAEVYALALAETHGDCAVIYH